MKPKPIMNSHYAVAHVDAIRRRITRAPTWEDVADAYDAGLKHAVHVDGRQRQRLFDYIKAMRVVNMAHQERAP
jgi:hypothetical protein